MEKVICGSLLLMLVTFECQAGPKPQTYKAESTSMRDSHSATSRPDENSVPGVQSIDGSYHDESGIVSRFSGRESQAATTQRPVQTNGKKRPGTSTSAPMNDNSGITWRTPQRPEGSANSNRNKQGTSTRVPMNNSGQTTPGSRQKPGTSFNDDHHYSPPQPSPGADRNSGSQQSSPGAPASDVVGQGSNCQSNHMQFPYPGTRHNNTDVRSAFCCAFVRPTLSPVDDSVDDVPDKPRIINNDLRQFALDLLIKLVEGEPNKNLIVSPFSVWNVMLMILEGARDDSDTAKEIRLTMKLHSLSRQKIQANYRTLECSLREASKYATFVSANALFYDVSRPPLPEYVYTVENKYQSDVIALKPREVYTAARTINSWVANKTQHRIKDIVQPGDLSNINLILANAVLFKGQWNNPFNTTATKKANFHNEKKEVISSVDMMFQRGDFLYSFIQEINAHVLDIPYEGSHFRMLVVLPKYNGTLIESLKAMKNFPVNVCYERLVEEQERYADEEVRVYLPRFKIKSDLQLKETLTQLGIESVFSNRANLSEMSNSSDLYLSKLVHVAEIEVNEEGTVASGVSVGSFGNKSKPPNFVANRPFAYFIVENHLKTVIFAGKVTDPNK